MTLAPLVLIAELTHRCPLRCAYCSNPVALIDKHREIDGHVWRRILLEAGELGVRMVHFTGGEPLLRSELEELVRVASEQSLYATLVTSGLSTCEPNRPDRLGALAAAGLRAVQVSFQGTRAGAGTEIAGRDAFSEKLAFARRVKQLGLSLTTNVVLHRDNIDRLAEFVQLSLELGADRVELAHVQYHGWAELNRTRLLPTENQIASSRRTVAELELALSARIDLVHVMPDYFSGRAKACMGGWGRRAIVIAPDGTVLPCHGAASLPLALDGIAEKPLADIWYDGAAFRAFRGEGWLEEPCASCSERGRDFGGCRCQAFAWTQRASATDPACPRSPHHHRIVELRRPSARPQGPYLLRRHAPGNR